MRLLFPTAVNSVPSGGRKYIYHIVDMLNESGMESLIVHPYNARLNWFDNDTQAGVCSDLFPAYRRKPIWKRLRQMLGDRGATASLSGHMERVSLTTGDVIVIPETRLSQWNHFPRWLPKIVLNQNQYFALDYHIPEVTGNQKPWYLDDSLLGMIVLSESNYEYQKFIFPKMNIAKAQLYIEEEFGYSSDKKFQICYMPRRGDSDARAVLNMLRYRGGGFR